MLARSAGFLEELATEISDAETGRGIAVPTDISEEGAVEAAFETIHRALGPADAPVNNVSSTETSGGGLLDATEADLAGAWGVVPWGSSAVQRPPPPTWPRTTAGRYCLPPRSRLSSPARTPPTPRPAALSAERDRDAPTDGAYWQWDTHDWIPADFGEQPRSLDQPSLSNPVSSQPG